MASARATNVILEFVDNGEKFRVELDPRRVGAIFFGESDFDRFRLKTLPNGAPNGDKFPDLTRLLAPGADSFGVRSEPTRAAPADEGEVVWWYTNDTWIHPSDPPQ